MKKKDDQQKQIAKIRKQAEAFVRKKAAQSSEYLDAMSPKEIRQILHELQVHQIELEMQNEELRRVQANLDKLVERYFDFYNIAPVGYLTISEKGLIVEANLTIATFLGVEKTKLIKKPFTNFVFLEDQDLYYKYRKQNFKTDTGAFQACELRIMKKDGTHFWVRMESTKVQDDNGEPTYRVVISNITECKIAEEKLQGSKAKIESIFDSSPDAITVTDLSGNIVECNQATLDAHGFSSKAEVLGKKAFMLIAEKDHQRATENMMKTLEQGVIKNAEYTLCKKDRSEFIGELSVSVIKDSYGKSIGFVAITKDITERKAAEETLKMSENNYKTIFNSSSDAIFVHNIPDMKIVDVNDEACKRYGYTKEEIKKLSFDELSSPEYTLRSPRNQKLLQRVINGDIVNSEWLSKKKNGKLFWNEMTGKIIELNGEKHFLAIAKDIDEIKKRQRKIEQQNIKLKKLDRIKNNFLNVTSHELRTPMSSIKGYVQMILKGKLGNVTEEERNALEVVLRNTNRLDHLIQDILDISLLESGSMKLIPEKTNIKDVVSEIVESMNCSALEKNIKIITEIDESLPDVILDKERIKQVFINLIDNSIKFSPYGTMINIRGKKQQKELLFEIQDKGRGIPEADQEKIFNLFHQVDSGEDRKYGGAGLGLAISKNIIDMHGGKVWVESEGKPGKGSIFKFVVPMNSKDYFKK